LRTLVVCLVLSLSSATGACANVKPYQRGKLAERCMRLDPDPQAQGVEQHVHEYREGATGATGVTGGGCGCN
jgi:hypothetical protein